MIFPRREEATNKELILTIIEIQGYLSRYGKTHTNWHETLNEVAARLEPRERLSEQIPVKCDDAISRQAVLDMASTIQTDDSSGNELLDVVEVDDIKALPPVTPQLRKEEVQNRLTNKEWIDLLSEQFDVSRTSARDMLHAMMSVKKEDNFKKQFNKPVKPEETKEDTQEVWKLSRGVWRKRASEEAEKPVQEDIQEEEER